MRVTARPWKAALSGEVSVEGVSIHPGRIGPNGSLSPCGTTQPAVGQSERSPVPTIACVGPLATRVQKFKQMRSGQDEGPAIVSAVSGARGKPVQARESHGSEAGGEADGA